MRDTFLVSRIFLQYNILTYLNILMLVFKIFAKYNIGVNNTQLSN